MFMPRHCRVEKIVKFLLLGRTLQRLDAVVNLGNLRLAGAEKTLWLKQVVDVRHKVGKFAGYHTPPAPLYLRGGVSSKVARVGGEISQPAVLILHHQHAQHLAGKEFVAPQLLAQGIVHHLGRRHLAQFMRHIVERKSEPRRQLHATHVMQEPM